MLVWFCKASLSFHFSHRRDVLHSPQITVLRNWAQARSSTSFVHSPRTPALMPARTVTKLPSNLFHCSGSNPQPIMPQSNFWKALPTLGSSSISSTTSETVFKNRGEKEEEVYREPLCYLGDQGCSHRYVMACMVKQRYQPVVSREYDWS